MISIKKVSVKEIFHREDGSLTEVSLEALLTDEDLKSAVLAVDMLKKVAKGEIELDDRSNTAVEKPVEVVEEQKKEEPVVVEEKPKKKKTTTKKVKVKYTPYDRSLDVHKKEFAKVLDENFPEWRKKYLAEAKDLSIQMEGEDFMDSRGEVLDTFKEAMVHVFGQRI